MIGKDFEGNSFGLMKVLSKNLLGETEETSENRTQGNWCTSQDSN
jgi:hypothetical protein